MTKTHYPEQGCKPWIYANSLCLLQCEIAVIMAVYGSLLFFHRFFPLRLIEIKKENFHVAWVFIFSLLTIFSAVKQY